MINRKYIKDSRYIIIGSKVWALKTMSTESMDIESDTDDQIEIIYEDEYLVAINKEAGLLVHRS